MDSILLQQIEVSTHIGVPDAERKNAQKIFVTIEIFCPLENIAKNNDVMSGIDYAKVTENVLSIAKTERKTIERFTQDIAESIPKKFKPEGGVRITVTKKPDLPLESASVTITRP